MNKKEYDPASAKDFDGLFDEERIEIPLSEDVNDVPMAPSWMACSNCGLPASILYSGVATYTDSDGFRRWRVRMHYKCKSGSCGKSSVYRLAGFETENGKSVKDDQKEKEEDRVSGG